MSRSDTSLSAHVVHDRLMTALTELRRAERNAVLWFAEILERRLYRQLGYASIHQYASEALGFSKGKTSQFIRLSESLRSLPRLKRAVAAGDIPWTKAREVATVATRSSEGRWIAAARTSSRRELEQRIAAAKAAGRPGTRSNPEQTTLTASANADRTSDPCGSPSGPPVSHPIPAAAAVQLRFSPEQLARFEALVEAARRAGARVSREELVLAALEADVTRARSVPVASPTPNASPPPASSPAPIVVRSPYQVVVYQCDSCQKAHIPTSRGDRPLDLATLRAIVCDSEVVGQGKRLRAKVSPGKRRAVLERDGHRCQAAGCRQSRSLQIHHLVPLEFGGTDESGNLITLCRGCHQWVHERRERLRVDPRGAEPPPP